MPARAGALWLKGPADPGRAAPVAGGARPDGAVDQCERRVYRLQATTARNRVRRPRPSESLSMARARPPGSGQADRPDRLQRLSIPDPPSASDARASLHLPSPAQAPKAVLRIGPTRPRT